MRRLSVLLLALGTALSAFAGSVEGRVTARGRDMPSDGAAGGGYSSRKARFFEKIDYSQLKDFVVWLETTNAVSFPKPDKPVQVVVQKDATFKPHVMPVVVGTTVEWPNADDIYHNVFSFSDPKPFDLGLYKDEVKRITFDKPGRVDIFCSIHKNMSCVILVLANPWFAAADEQGRYAIRDVPPGRYTLKAWHERLPPHAQEIEVGAGTTNRIDVIMGVSGLPQI